MNRLVGLDIMRSIAILIVIYEHARHYVPPKYTEIYNTLNIFKIDGVTIFFVLSGYLIGGIFIKELVNVKPGVFFW
jgi:peptidoglycan/LPS O-acetylase OafA/YrhL